MSEYRDQLEKLSPVERTAVIAEELANSVPVVYKHYMVSKEMLMVIGGLKGCVEIQHPKKNLVPEEVSALKQSLENVGLRLYQVEEGVTFNDKTNRKENPLQYFVVYNPKTLEQQTSDTKFALPYSASQDLGQYLKESRGPGARPHVGVDLKLLSVPDSAIAFRMSKGGQGTVTEKSYSEKYIRPEDPGDDVIQREKDKDEFFQELSASDQLMRARHSKDIELSETEFKKRMQEAFSR